MTPTRCKYCRWPIYRADSRWVDDIAFPYDRCAYRSHYGGLGHRPGFWRGLWYHITQAVEAIG